MMSAPRQRFDIAAPLAAKSAQPIEPACQPAI